MELFETYFEEPIISNESYKIGDISAGYEKFLQKSFLPDFVEKLKLYEKDVNNPKNKKVLEKTIDQLSDLEKECEDIIENNGMTGSIMLRKLGMFIYSGGGITSLISDFNKLIKGKNKEVDEDEFCEKIIKIAKKVLPKVKALKSKAENKIKNI